MHDLVLIPGLGSDEAVWSATIDNLGVGVRCTVGDTLQDRSLPEMAQRILAAAPSHFVLAGVSMGGMVALEIMRTQPSASRVWRSSIATPSPTHLSKPTNVGKPFRQFVRV